MHAPPRHVARGWAHLRSASFFEADAVSAFQAATVLDPTYVAAYAGLAHAKVHQENDRHVLVEAFGEATAAALRAVALGGSMMYRRVTPH